jgi:tRNA pseudouridine38-40 synthase
MRNILLTVEYDGTGYAGWQTQPNAIAVQQLLEGALQKVAGHPVELRSSGRTDAGVHAAAMPAVFCTNTALPLAAYTEGVNRFLPDDIAVLHAQEVPLRFDPIRDAAAKRYRYSIHNELIRSPLVRYRSWHVREKLDMTAMRQAATHFAGVHDFGSFRASNSGACTSTRRIDAVAIGQDGAMITVDVTGGGFLKNMVRIMVGTLVDVGRGRFAPEHIVALLNTPDRKQAGVTAPACGLCLMEVVYPASVFVKE